MRLAVVVVTGLSFTLLLGALMLVPSYLHVRSERITLEARLASLRDPSQQDGVAIQDIIKETNREIAVLSSLIGQKTSADVFEQVIAVRPKGITINGLYKERKETAEEVITLRGVAVDRNALLAFADALRANSFFSGVTVPISNFASSKDIAFSLSFTLRHARE